MFASRRDPARAAGRRRAGAIAAVTGVALAALLTSAGTPATGAPAVSAPAAPGVWATAVEVPGTVALNKSGDAEVLSVSCATAADCGAGGSYEDASVHLQAFVANKAGGTWGSAIEVPGTAALNKGGAAWVASVSCPSAGECLAGGSYTDAAGHVQAFVATEAHGRWGSAIALPGIQALNRGGSARITSVSCAAAGECVAGGSYTDAAGHVQAFVATEAHGTWRRATEAPGTAALNKGGLAKVAAVSCGAVGDCGAGGSYTDRDGHVQAFVLNETHGRWGTAIEVPETAALNKGGSAKITSVSCTAPGECGAGGSYADGANLLQAFVVDEKSGRWGAATVLPGSEALNKGGAAWVTTVSCAKPGECAAGGSYTDADFYIQAFIVSEQAGQWTTAVEVPGTADLNQGGIAKVTSVSCPSPATCAAAGSYTDDSYRVEPFVVDQKNGTWAAATEVPGTNALNATGNGAATSVSCASAGHCTVGGMYDDADYKFQTFVADQG
jgi:hypothetical protein